MFYKMIKTALITGATSGIGYEFCKIHAINGGNLIVVARNKKKLEEIKFEFEKQYKISVFVIVKDLSNPNSANEVFNEIKQNNIKIDYLINNAGFGIYGEFTETSLEKEEEMINLNILSLTKLTKLFYKEMLSQNGGKIMNIASIAAFQSGPLMSAYFASKAYVLNFTEGLAYENKNKNITFTAFCPGATDSKFHSVSGFENSNLVKTQKLPSAEYIANIGYNDMLKGKVVSIPVFRDKLLITIQRFVPRCMVAKVTGYIIREKK